MFKHGLKTYSEKEKVKQAFTVIAVMVFKIPTLCS